MSTTYLEREERKVSVVLLWLAGVSLAGACTSEEHCQSGAAWSRIAGATCGAFLATEGH